jgi:hypothetical protein
VSSADQTVERAADAVERASERAAERGGVAAKLAEPLAEDADFLRKLKPSLMKKRAKGELPTDEEPGTTRHAPSAPQLGSRPSPKPKKTGGGPSPFLVLAAGFAIGIALAKWIDWRGHAHPRG